MSQDAESKKQQEMMSRLTGGSDAFRQLSLIPGAAEQVLALTAAADPVFFNQPPGSPFAVGSEPIGVAVGDFNGNGFLDLVIANNKDNNVSVLLNHGDGTFAAAQNFFVGNAPIGVAVGDFNGDGKLDIVTANFYSDGVSVLLNTTVPGSATVSFAAAQNFPVGASPWGVAVGDFNGDGKLDIVTANFYSGDVSVLLNTTAPGSATASFATAQNFSIGSFLVGVAVGDFNGDGKLDIVTANDAINSVSVLLNTTAPGSATVSFAAARNFSVGSNPEGVAVGDFNGDGKLDIVAANNSGASSSISVLLNTTAPGSAIASFAAHQDFSVGTGPIGVAVGDFNGDGKLDIVAANSGGNNVSVLLNTTAPGSAVASFAAHQDFSVGTGPQFVAVGNFNGDGKLDIVATNSGSNNVTVLLQSPLVVNVETIHASQNVLFSGPIATITGAHMASDTHVTINWGDGSPLDTTGTVSQNLDGSLAVSGSHIYKSLGTFSITVTATEGIFTSKGAGQAIVQVPLAVQVNTIQASAKVQFSGPVATINGANSASDTTAMINWGDGTPATQGTISGSGNTLTVSGSHMYSQGGIFTLTVTATEGTRSAQGTGQAMVLAVEVVTIQAVATVPFSGAVAIISGANSPNDTTASINWGDGTPATPGTPVANPDGTLTVSGMHTYNAAGPFTLRVIATEGSRTAQGAGQAIVQPPLTVQVNTIQASAKVSFNGPVATISGANSAGDTTALINWGDGTPTMTGTVSGSGILTVSGSHTYSQGGTFTVTVTATEGTRRAQGTGQAMVQPALAVEVATIQAVATMPFSGAVAIINGAISASDTTAMINWGDNTTTPGTVVANPDGTLTVSGTHTYTQGGTFPLIVTASEGIRTATGTGQAIVKTANLHARAFGVQSLNPLQGPLGDASIPPTGGNQTATVPSVLLPGLVVSGITDTVSGSLTPTPPHANASSTISTLFGFSITPEMIEDPDEQALVASGISAMAHADLSTPSGVLSGATTFASLIIGSTIFPAHFAPGANTVVPLPGLGTVTLNEQTVTQNANQILIVVNALHIHITQGPQADTDIVVGHVEAGITLS